MSCKEAVVFKRGTSSGSGGGSGGSGGSGGRAKSIKQSNHHNWVLLGLYEAHNKHDRLSV